MERNSMNTSTIQPEQTRTANSASVYEDAFQFMPGYCYLLDNNCVLIDCNQRLLQHLGLQTIPDKSVGSIYKMMIKHGFWTEEQIQSLKQTDINAILTAEPQRNTQELPVIDDKGGIIHFEASRIPLVNQSGEVYALLVIFQDVTAQRQMADQFEKISTELKKQNANPSVTFSSTKSAEVKTTPPKILIVEDNAIAQKAAQSILMNNDCLVEIADTEARLQELFEPGKYDLVFMDIGLENTSGYIMAKQLRQREKDTGHHVPIIALTGYAADVVQFDCDYYQMEGVITKPLTAEQVKQIIQHYILNINLEITGLKSASRKQEGLS